MKVIDSVELEQQLEKLSQRLGFYRDDRFRGIPYVDDEIKVKNLKYNLSYLLAQIILKLEIPKPTLKEFSEVINKFNKKYNSRITFEEYLSDGWVRIINDKVVVPEVIGYYIRQISCNKGQNKETVFSPRKEKYLRCLGVFYNQYLKDDRVFISEKELFVILQKFQVNVQFFEEKKILEKDNSKNFYKWRASEYLQDLETEILSTVWLLLYEKQQNIDVFKRFIHILNFLDYYPNSLEEFLPVAVRNVLSEYSITLLTNEKDLDNSKIESNKIWLDSESYPRIGVSDLIPNFEIKGSNPFDLILEFEKLQWFFPNNVFGREPARIIYSKLLLFTKDPTKYKQSYPYENYLKFLNNVKKPYLVKTIYTQIKEYFPEVIPYLLLDTNHLPLAFKLVNSIEFSPKSILADSSPENKSKEINKIRTEFWLDFFSIVLRLKPEQDYCTYGKVVFQILYDLAQNVFVCNLNNQKALSRHDGYRKCYGEALKLLSESKQECNFSTRLYSKKLFPSIISELVDTALLLDNNSPRSEYISFNLPLIDLLIEILKISNSFLQSSELVPVEKENIETGVKKITSFLVQELENYYTYTKINVETGGEIKTIKRNEFQFGYEIIDWGALYLEFINQDQFFTIDDRIQKSLTFNTTSKEGQYEDTNKEQKTKLRLYVKSLLLAYLGINAPNSFFPYNNFVISTAFKNLENFITKYVRLYSRNNITEGQIDIFEEKYVYLYQHNIYYQKLNFLLFNAINHFKTISPKEVVQHYFSGIEDIGRKLSAINILSNKDCKDIVSGLIEQFDINSYTSSEAHYKTLERLLIEVVNSESYWEWAEPLLEKAQERLKQTKLDNGNTQDFLFRVKLLFALKKKDWKLLSSIEVPQKKYQVVDISIKRREYKEFYMALYKIYHKKDLEYARRVLSSLVSKYESNIEYQYYLYYIQTHLAYENNEEALPQAKERWDRFFNTVKERKDESSDEIKKLLGLSEAIECLNVLHYAYREDFLKFDQSVNRLSENFLYDDITGMCIYNTYMKRDMHETAGNYISDAVKYYESHNKEIPTKINKLFYETKSPFLLKKYKATLVNVRNLEPQYLVSIIPDILNGKRELNLFILNELIQALKIALDKIKSVEQIKYEDRYNDLVLAILRLRFPIWGWSILDQPRIGSSPEGKRAGEVDHLLQFAGNNITLFEGFLLAGKNTKTITSHILKTEVYVSYLNKYYMIVYYNGKSQNFSSTWDSYKEVVLGINYPESLRINKQADFIDLKNEFENVRGFEIAKTFHGENNGVELYHIMVDFSDKG